MKIKKLILGITILLSMASVQAQVITVIDSGYCGSQGNNLTWVLYSDSTLAISGSGAMNDFGINSAPWYSHRGIIKTAIIGDSVTAIGNNAFRFCNLTSITIGNSVTTIGNNVFLNCSNFTSINVDTNNLCFSSIGDLLYNKLLDTLILCPEGKVGIVTIPNFVTTLRDRAFNNCQQLTSVIIPNSVITIGSYAFYQCFRLTVVSIGNSVTMIGNLAFYNCVALSYITCNAIIPPVIYEYTFIIENAFIGEIKPINASVYVPCRSYNVYRTANYWDSFPNFIGMSDTIFIFDTICQGAVYNNNGFNINNGAGVYYRTNTTPNYCNIVTCLMLSEYAVVPIAHYSASICQGDIYTDSNFINFTKAGDYYDTLQNIHGCDSIVKLTLIVNSTYITQISDSICEGGSYNFFGELLTSAGIYYDTLQTIHNCDSIIELTLTVTGVGIKETRHATSLQVYPNPTAGLLMIEIASQASNDVQGVEIYDEMGKTLLSYPSLPSFLDISHFPSGTYFIRVNKKINKIIKK